MPRKNKNGRRRCVYRKIAECEECGNKFIFFRKIQKGPHPKHIYCFQCKKITRHFQL